MCSNKSAKVYCSWPSCTESSVPRVQDPGCTESGVYWRGVCLGNDGESHQSLYSIGPKIMAPRSCPQSNDTYISCGPWGGGGGRQTGVLNVCTQRICQSGVSEHNMLLFRCRTKECSPFPIRVIECIAPRHEFNRMNSIKKGKIFQFLASFTGRMASGWLTGFTHAHYCLAPDLWYRVLDCIAPRLSGLWISIQFDIFSQNDDPHHKAGAKH